MNTTIEEQVRMMSDEGVQANLDYLMKGSYTERFINAWRHFVDDFAYDRVVCQAVGANYSRMNKVDFARLKVYAYNWMRQGR